MYSTNNNFDRLKAIQKPIEIRKSKMIKKRSLLIQFFCYIKNIFKLFLPLHKIFVCYCYSAEMPKLARKASSNRAARLPPVRQFAEPAIRLALSCRFQATRRTKFSLMAVRDTGRAETRSVPAHLWPLDGRSSSSIFLAIRPPTPEFRIRLTCWKPFGTVSD